MMIANRFSARSLLFVPADRPDRFAKALASGADAICIDLEDAVAPDAKPAARQTTLDYLAAQPDRTAICVRLNGLETPEGLDDLLALARHVERPAAIILPKIEAAAQVRLARRIFMATGSTPQLIALIETASGMAQAPSIAAEPGLTGLALGPVDLEAELGATLAGPGLAFLRIHLRLAATAAGVALWDGPFLDVNAPQALVDDCAQAASSGLDGKLCIHPSQVETVNSAFGPTSEDRARAAAVLAAAELHRGAAFLHEGKMVDAPVLARARRILGRSWRVTSPS